VSETLVLRLKKGREESILRRHPWIFSGALVQSYHHLPEGTWVQVADHQGHLMATGLFCHGSVSVRVVHFGNEALAPEDIIGVRIKEAYSCRQNMGFSMGNTSAFRLINGEGDGLPGIITDVYADILVVQVHHAGWMPWLRLLEEKFITVLSLPREAIIFQTYFRHMKKNSLPSREAETIQTLWIEEHDLWYEIKPGHGQKTGFFLDQRENREYCRSLSFGKRVLNLFSFTGGFSLNALKGGAVEVLSVDSSSEALEVLKRQLIKNNLEVQNHTYIKADVFKWIKTIDEKFDLIICDPPALAKNLQTRHQATMAYKRLHEDIFKKVSPGGLLMTFSCTSVVTPDLFEGALRAAAINCGRHIRVLKILGPDVDHPWSFCHSEGRYLKGFLFQLE